MSSRKSGLPVLKGKVSRVKEGLLDGVDILLGRRSWDTPPRRLMFVGDGNFSRTGERYLHFFVDACALHPDAKVLDVGCGVGRMAIPLTSYLSPQGEYRGLDIVRPGIDWCRRNITARFPNFQFEWADVFNSTYNPLGSLRASTYRFPYDCEQFDFVFLTSVFTHMLRSDVEHYLSEIHRVLRVGGRCACTYFLLNEESLALLASGKSSIAFKHDLEGYLSTDPASPEAAVAYREDEVATLYAGNGFIIEAPTRYGRWCGRKGAIRFQDIVVARKTP